MIICLSKNDNLGQHCKVIETQKLQQGIRASQLSIVFQAGGSKKKQIG